jgi:hypothetical protein
VALPVQDFEEPRPAATGASGELIKAATTSRADRVLAGVCLAAVVFLLLQILSFGYGRDQGIYAMVGRSILEGGMPYRDAWDFKPPGIFVIFAAARAIFGDAQVGVRVFEVIGLGATVFGLVRLAEELWGERLIGLLAGAIAVLVHAQLDFWHTAQPESFGGMLTVGALLLLVRGERRLASGEERRAAIAWVAAGALFGAAGLLKPPLAGGGAVAAVLLALRSWRASAPAEAEAGRAARSRAARSRAALRPVALIAAGGVLPVAVCLVWFAAKGALSDLHKVLFVFTPHYTAIGWEGVSPFGMAYYGFREWLSTYSSVTTVGLLLLLGFGLAKEERQGALLLGGVIAIHLVGVVMQGKFFPYHYGATWPITSLLAALGFWKVWAITGRRSARGAAAFAAAFVLVALGQSATKDVPGSFLRRTLQRTAIFAAGGRDQEAIDKLASVADVNAVANRAVADFLRARVPADRPVFVWGFEPVIYDLAGRSPSSRYIYNVAQRVAWAKEPARAALMRDLAARPPAAIVVERRDVFPMVTGDAIDSADTLHDFTALRDLLHARYAMATSIEDFDIWLEKPGQPSGP